MYAFTTNPRNSSPHSIPQHSQDSKALDTSFKSHSNETSTTMMSPPNVNRKTTQHSSHHYKTESGVMKSKHVSQTSSPTRKENQYTDSGNYRQQNQIAGISSDSKRYMHPFRKSDSERNVPNIGCLNDDDRKDKLSRNKTRDDKEGAELPANVTSAFNDVNISFGSENVFHLETNEREFSFLSPLAK